MKSTRELARFGEWSALAALAAAAGYGVVQILQIAGVLRFPWDEISIFAFSIAIPVPFVLALVALHHAVPEHKRHWTHAAIALATAYAVLVTIVYPTQLALVIPERLAGNAAAVAHLMVTKGTVMWIVDGAGYIALGIATLLAAGALAGDDEAKWLRRFMIANGLLDPVIVAIYAFPSLLPVGSLWLVTAPGSMWLLARHFRRACDPPLGSNPRSVARP